VSNLEDPSKIVSQLKKQIDNVFAANSEAGKDLEPLAAQILLALTKYQK
jgi:hypothetical protein